jgi:hypothetical protein
MTRVVRECKPARGSDTPEAYRAEELFSSPSGHQPFLSIPDVDLFHKISWLDQSKELCRFAPGLVENGLDNLGSDLLATMPMLDSNTLKEKNVLAIEFASPNARAFVDSVFSKLFAKATIPIKQFESEFRSLSSWLFHRYPKLVVDLQSSNQLGVAVSNPASFHKCKAIDTFKPP